MGEQQVPSYGLAAMAMRGSKRALDLLASDLNDSRRYVREWALAAIAQSLGPTRGLPALKAAQPSLKFADTRAAVDRTIKQWEQEGQKTGTPGSP